ncbi:sugar phosphate isomerase/epimerase family protein [Nitrospirota bacterium]
MKLAISNIAWERHDDPQVLHELREHGVDGIEIAPTKIWPEWEGANQQKAEQYRKRMIDEGFQIPAMQAILFGKPDLRLFDPESHNAILEHIKLVADLAAGLEAEVLVLGAPKNRIRGQLSMANAMEMAKELLLKAGEICFDRGCCIGFEHNPIEYNCDFITNAADARVLVDLINHPGIQLHLDSAGIHMCGGDIGRIINSVGSFVHYHVSEPMLVPIAGGVVNHRKALSSLDTMGYSKWISIEMNKPERFELVERSLVELREMLVDSTDNHTQIEE